MTAAPASANACAVASPMPEAAPVTSATLFSNDRFIVVPFFRLDPPECGRRTVEREHRGLVVDEQFGLLLLVPSNTRVEVNRAVEKARNRKDVVNIIHKCCRTISASYRRFSRSRRSAALRARPGAWVSRLPP